MCECSANRVFLPTMEGLEESAESREVAEAPGTGGKPGGGEGRRSQYLELQPEVWWNRNGKVARPERVFMATESSNLCVDLP